MRLKGSAPMRRCTMATLWSGRIAAGYRDERTSSGAGRRRRARLPVPGREVN